MQTQEQNLVKRSQEGDLQAFNQLVELYQTQLYGLAYNILRNTASAEDITQESFISAFKSIGKFRGGSFKAWLFRIVTNTSIDYLRSSKRHPSESLDESIAELGFDVASKEESPEEHAMRRELRSEIERGLHVLPYDQRMAATLVDIQGLSYEEAAEALGISSGTLKSRLSRGRFRLRDFLLQKPELLQAEFRLSK